MATEPEIRAVRLLIPDTDAVFGEAEDEYIFSDEDITIFLLLGKGNAMWAAGLASQAIGGSEALIGKVIRNYETETDGSKLAKEWLAKGTFLINEGRKEYAEEGESFFITAFPQWGIRRHPEGQSHGSYRGVAPTNYQW